MISFADRVVVVTGAGRGIGNATARTIAELGGTVIAHDIAREDVEELARALGENVLPVVADLADLESLERFWSDVVSLRGRVDVLINNAGIYEPASIDDDLDVWTRAWDRMLTVCLTAPATLCREAIKTFRTQGGGIIVNLASRAAWRGEDADYWHYAAAKSGIVAMTKTIARQYGRDGITAHAVAPGFVNTSFNDAPVEQYGLEFFANDTALGEVAGPQDLANVITFLASGLARHTTGATVDVNSASYVR